MSIVLERVDIDKQATELRHAADTLVEIVRRSPTGIDKKNALLEAARKLEMPLSRMTYVLTFAKAEREIAVDAGSSRLRAI